ncbi:helicase [Goodfellowiella coeruleoviolacea]|uniref:Helicase n=1 Tax=Goodfellowiella coeruleoviolacea TaxID=334858 RepID=A0AAE3GFT4_9PSEU|nr:helicase [Goodfellowiella coeruleoviolacea]
MEPGAPGARLHWLKIADPDAPLPDIPADADVRVLLPADERFAVLREKLIADDVPVRLVPHLLEQETVSSVGRDGRLTVGTAECHLARPVPREFSPVSGAPAAAAMAAFDLMWHTHEPVDQVPAHPVPAERLVPADWLTFLPHPTLNPAQAQAVPHVLDETVNLLVVAPTGAGKTVIGMLAALRTVTEQGRKAAWLVPQRSLTDELDRELETWRQRGLRVERLSGEYSVDVDRVREADLWVATTEKFEAICRASSLREALAEVGCLIVDEIHLLGDATRGPVLEALLARVRDEGSGIRTVGLSATVSNAEQIAAWLRARLVRIAWRPSRLTWQLPVVASSTDWGLVETARTRLASAITTRVAAEHGSVLVFCGSKRGVRRTALIIAAARGADIHGVHPDDLDRLHRVCRSVGVGLHYKGWDHRREAERAFRARDIDVLVATSTLAAGVNLPARAVVVRDTQVGLNSIDVATVQQMFGRAGRVGTGEAEGWAFLIVDETERAAWQAKLVAGHAVSSQIQSSLADHVLAEAVQRRIHSPDQAEQWWVRTLAHHQGNRSLAPLRQAIAFLVAAGYLTVGQDEDGRSRFAPTELGVLTARLMVSTTIGHRLRTALANAALPGAPADAERTLIALVATLVPKLVQAPIGEEHKGAVTRLLAVDGRLGALADQSRGTGVEAGLASYAPGDLARATLLVLANTPGAFHARARLIGGVPYATMYPVLEEAPRYLHWLGCQGLLGTVPPWAAVVAADLGKRVRWRRCQPTRGAGRLLWMCEQMATPAWLDTAVPALWAAATARGVTSPDWSATGQPRHCHLDAAGYAALLRDRATGVVIDQQDDHAVTATGPAGAVLAVWTGRQHALVPLRGGSAVARFPEGSGPTGAAVFTWRGDYLATGWLTEYTRIGSAPEDRHPVDVPWSRSDLASPGSSPAANSPAREIPGTR